MRFELTIRLRDGRWSTTVGSDPTALSGVAELVAGIGVKNPDVQFTIQADRGPDVTGRIGEIASVRLEVAA